MPDADLRARREELADAAYAEARVANPRGRLEGRIEKLRDGRTRLEAEQRTETVLHPEGSEALSRIEVNQRILAGQLARNEAELTQMPEVGDSARRELAVAEGVLAERREMVTLAARLDPPAYVRNELGERPHDPAKQKTWDRGVAQIEGYRHKNEIKDPNKPFGPEAKRGAERARQEAALRRLQRTQKALGLGQHAARTRALGRGMSIGR